MEFSHNVESDIYRNLDEILILDFFSDIFIFFFVYSEKLKLLWRKQFLIFLFYGVFDN